jgi:hypothetical protein
MGELVAKAFASILDDERLGLTEEQREAAKPVICEQFALMKGAG